MVDASPNRATMLVLAYLWPLAVVPLLVSKDDTEVQWHAKHGLVLMAAELLAVLALSVLASVMTMMAFGVGLALSVLLYILLWATILIIHVLAMIKALGGSRLEVPAVSRYVSRF
jgi:hypothetical protein